MAYLGRLRKFGVEIECYVPAEYVEEFRAGGYHNGIQLINAPDGWNAQHDGSISGYAPAGYVAVEIVSPVLMGQDGLNEVWYVTEYLQKVGARVNSHCGLHVHVDAHGISSQGIENIKRRFIMFELAFFALNGDMAKNRFQNRYCAPSHTWGHDERANRYQSLNFTNLRYDQKKTLEFRLFAGTISSERVTSAISMCVALMVDTLNNPNMITSARIDDINTSVGLFLNDILMGSTKNRIVPQYDLLDVMAVLLSQTQNAASLQALLSPRVPLDLHARLESVLSQLEAMAQATA